MQNFSQGIHPYVRPLRPHLFFRTIRAIRRAYLAYTDSIYPPIPRPENMAPRFVRAHPESAPAAPAQDVPHDSDSLEDDDSESEPKIEIDGGDPDYDLRHDD